MQNGCGCVSETWQCQQGLTEVQMDAAGCPIDQRFCKTQVGDTAAAVAAGAAFTLTIAVPNFSDARVAGLVLSAVDPATGADWLDAVTLSSISIQGTEELGGGTVSAGRYRRDANGANCGTGQAYRGRLGTTGGSMVITGVNNGAATLFINATADINAIR